MKKYDVTALGELLIDFIENGTNEHGNSVFEANPGGAPCNVLAMLSKLGRKTAFIGKVGNDMFGRKLAGAVRAAGISDEGLVFDDSISTTLAFVHTLTGGEREFSFVRNPGADMMLTADEVNIAMIKESEVNAIEKTGAGDTFFGCALSCVCDCDISELDENSLTEILKFSNAGAAIITTRKGALKAMPELNEIRNLMENL